MLQIPSLQANKGGQKVRLRRKALKIIRIRPVCRYLSLRSMNSRELWRALSILVKQQLCGSGMRWKDQEAKVILSLRAWV
jgi:hypothetical protein